VLEKEGGLVARHESRGMRFRPWVLRVVAGMTVVVLALSGWVWWRDVSGHTPPSHMPREGMAFSVAIRDLADFGGVSSYIAPHFVFTPGRGTFWNGRFELTASLAPGATRVGPVIVLLPMNAIVFDAGPAADGALVAAARPADGTVSLFATELQAFSLDLERAPSDRPATAQFSLQFTWEPPWGHQGFGRKAFALLFPRLPPIGIDLQPDNRRLLPFTALDEARRSRPTPAEQIIDHHGMGFDGIEVNLQLLQDLVLRDPSPAPSTPTLMPRWNDPWTHWLRLDFTLLDQRRRVVADIAPGVFFTDVGVGFGLVVAWVFAPPRPARVKGRRWGRPARPRGRHGPGRRAGPRRR
jgi:hypothetical protein